MKSFGILAILYASAVSASLHRIQHRTSSNWTVGQTVQTSSGPVNGHAASNDSQVSEYLGIPFGQAPIGDLRFAAPVKYTGNTTHNGTDYVSFEFSTFYLSWH